MMYDFTRPSTQKGQEPSPVLSARFGDALCMAAGLHRRQSRKGGSVPYASHLLAVASLVLQHGGTEDEAIAALLHDAVEDQAQGEPKRLKDEIERRFGRAVLDVVLGCTDSEEYEYTEEVERKDTWRLRKEHYVQHLADASTSVLLVSLADKTHNAQSIVRDHADLGERLWGRFNASKEETLWYYEALVGAFEARMKSSLFEEFKTAVQKMRACVVPKVGG